MSASIDLARYNKSNVLTIAWSLVKSLGYKISEALKIAWVREKTRANKVYRSLTASEKAVINSRKSISKSTWVATPEIAESLHEFYHNTNTYKGD